MQDEPMTSLEERLDRLERRARSVGSETRDPFIEELAEVVRLLILEVKELNKQ